MKPARLFLLGMLLVCLTLAWSQDPADQEKRLKTAAGREKLSLLIELCRGNLRTNPNKVVEYGGRAEALLKKFPDDKTELGLLDLICQAHLYLGDYDQALNYAEKSLQLTQRINDRPRSGIAMNIMAIIHMQTGDFVNAREYALQAVEIFRTIPSEKGKKVLASALNNIGISYDMQGNYEKALEYYLQSLKIKEALGDRKAIASSLNNVGIILGTLGRNDEALKYYNQVLAIKEELKDRTGMASQYVNIGNIHKDDNDLPRAMEFYRNALDIYRETENQSGIASVLFNIGSVETLLKNLRSARGYFRNSLELRRQMGEKEGTARTLIELGGIELLLGRPDQARRTLEEGLSLAGEIGALAQVRDGNLALSQVWEFRRDYVRALRYYKEYKNTADQIINSQSNKKIAELQTRYESEKKEQEILLLKKNSEIQALRLKSRELQRNLMVGALVILISGVLFLVYRYRYIFTFWKKKNYIGHYRIIEQMGSGGMGTIYRAVDVVDPSHRTIAVKVLREEYFKDDVQKKRFKQEASLIDQVVHPNIVHVIERGESDTGLYIAMEVLEGPTLGEFLTHNPEMQLSQAVGIMVQIADALESIHAMNIVHRDLKPDNIKLVKRDGNPHFVKLLDFGLAMTQHMSRLTETGMVVGTIFYLSPEQIAGEDITPASDIHSLGVIFYEMLVGAKPFTGETTLEVMRQISTIEPVDICTFRSDLDTTLSILIMLMLNKDPRLRPTAAMTFDALKSITRNDASRQPPIAP
ncbi:MAG TPA: tetratricopeptide repeat protein [Candidatus Aminicenantes bacterium]|nr:tetratricopeptide repeat protein [Candidatus Aminicenantes bacterium]